MGLGILLTAASLWLIKVATKDLNKKDRVLALRLK
jgi:hypothetical protein